MDRESLLRAVANRMPWQAAGRILLKAASFDITRGAESTLRAALASPADATRDARLAALLQDHSIAGEKLIRIVKLTSTERSKLLAWIRGKRRTQHSLSDAFPGVASDNDVRASALQVPLSLGHVVLEHGEAAMFTAVRSYLDRVELNVGSLKAGINDGYEELFATKRVYTQTFEGIWLAPTLDYAFLIADLPVRAPSGFAKESQVFLEVQLRQQLGRPVQCLNLWDAIEGLYQSQEGRLVDHGFVNNADAVKTHTARRGGRSLRTDPYDLAGAAAVGDDLLTFKVAVAWPRDGATGSTGHPEVLLPGTARLLHKSSLDHFIVRNCLSSRDLAFVVSRVLANL